MYTGEFSLSLFLFFSLSLVLLKYLGEGQNILLEFILVYQGHYHFQSRKSVIRKSPAVFSLRCPQK